MDSVEYQYGPTHRGGEIQFVVLAMHRWPKVVPAALLIRATIQFDRYLAVDPSEVQTKLALVMETMLSLVPSQVLV